jgi:hypothetical protein
MAAAETNTLQRHTVLKEVQMAAASWLVAEARQVQAVERYTWFQ